MDAPLVQPGLFGDVERSRLRRRITRQIKKISGKQQHQYSLKIRTRKTPRVIDFKPRLFESAGNDARWSETEIARLHIELIREWEERFQTCPFSDQVGYWLWMLGSAKDDFSFRNCLMLTGFTNPEAVIDGLYDRRPDWYRDIEGMTDDDQVLKTLQRHMPR